MLSKCCLFATYKILILETECCHVSKVYTCVILSDKCIHSMGMFTIIQLFGCSLNVFCTGELRHFVSLSLYVSSIHHSFTSTWWEGKTRQDNRLHNVTRDHERWTHYIPRWRGLSRNCLRCLMPCPASLQWLCWRGRVDQNRPNKGGWEGEYVYWGVMGTWRRECSN